jgi:internalin A
MPDKSPSVAALIEEARRTHALELDLSEQGLTELPESVEQLTQLQRLYLHSNQLTTLPESVGQLTQLHGLYLHSNQLTTLPESVGQLTQLQTLYLSDNQLTTLPESLIALRSLVRLYLHGNDALGLPAEVLGPKWQEPFSQNKKPANPAEILAYYFWVLRGGRRPLNEAKLILVGRGAVGKTSLVNRLVHDQFDRGEEKTEGIRITEWPLLLNGNEDVRLNVWDFGGQEIMHATHQFFLTQRSLYLLVLNGRAGGEDVDAEYWLKLIESFGDESPVIVVLNKIKEQPFDVNRRALQQKYPVRCFIKTDCADKTGLVELRRAIERETDQLEHLRDAFPASWFTIKDRLARMEQNYLSFAEYRAVCAELGEQDASAQELLASYLHSLGIALNYKDDPRLQDMHVLNPHWVTNGIYKILNAEKLEQQKGEIRLGELAKILDLNEYPIRMHRFIFDLMKKFELCFSFPNNDTHYLIPELLDKQEPLQTAEFKSEECLNFQYHYPVLPEGLLPRFIVRTHTLSEGLARWRTGVILRFEDNHALVKADVPDKKVFISVSGPMPSRRRLLAVIRADFERIHHDIRNLQPQEMVPLPAYPNAVVPYQELLVLEQEGEREFKKVVGGRVLKLDVHELLNGVDLEGTRRRERKTDEQQHAARLFYSYSHKDERLRNDLETHLKLLQRQGLIETWHDRQIEAGDEWKRKIDDNLERADIILLLVSATFIASEYCFAIELTRALERHDKGEAIVIPIILRDVDLKDAPFAKLQYLPTDGKAITTWRNKDSAWRNVAEGIREVVEGRRRKSGR